MVFGRLMRRRATPAAVPRAETASSVPEGLRLYAVGDIHGRADLLERLLGLVETDLGGFGGEAVTIFLGDYVDRGPSSSAVLDRLSRGEWPTPILPLRGNHEDAFLGFLAVPDAWNEWRHYGGITTVAAYGVNVGPLMSPSPDRTVLVAARDATLAAIPQPHVDFMRGLDVCTAVGDYFFCHAGVLPGVPLAEQSHEVLTTIREPFLSSEADFGKVVVHGHTPHEEPVIRPNRIGIDTGAYATGRLTALVLEGASRRLIVAT